MLKRGEGSVTNIFIGLHKMCKSLAELADLVSDEKRSWEDIFMALFDICQDAQEQALIDMASKQGMVKRKVRV